MKRFAALAAFLLGCTGTFASEERAAVPSAPLPMVAPPAAADGCAAPRDPGPVFLRRLTVAEYRRSVRDLFGAGPDRTGELPPDPVIDGFDNNAEAITLSDAHLEKFRDAAERIADDLLRDPARRAALLGGGCDVRTDADCLGRFVSSVGRRVYRRPLDAEEQRGLGALASGADMTDSLDGHRGIALVLQAMLLSPHFLFRVEVGRPERAGLLALTGFEVATRLSYLLRGTTPDEALLAAAEQGKLDGADGIAAAAEALLAAPAARTVMRGFAAQWLGFPLLASAARDPARYPLWNAALGASMQEETLRLFDDFAWREGMLDLLVAPYTWFDVRLAKLYGRPAPAGWTRIEPGPDEGRAGLITQPSVLTATAKNEAALAIHRGKFLREQILCERLPPPPDDVPQIVPSAPGQSEAQRLAQHRRDPACSGCHSRLDPLGLGLSRFDMIGAVRRTDAAGQPVTSEGSLSGFGPPEFDGAPALARALRGSPAVASCLVEQIFRFAHGRRPVPADACTLASLDEAFTRSGHDLRAVLRALVTSDRFSTRRPHTADVRPEEVGR